MSSPKGILIQSNFLYHMRHGEIVLHWFTTRAILKFFQLVIATLTIVFSIKHSKIPYSLEFFNLSFTTVNWIVCLVLYVAHFIECPAPPYVDASFSALAAVAGLMSFVFEIAIESFHDYLFAAALTVGMALHMIELICAIWNDSHKNFLYRYLSKKRRPVGPASTPRELRKKGVKFSTSPNSYREPSVIDDSEEDEEDYDHYYFRREPYEDDEKYVHVQF